MIDDDRVVSLRFWQWLRVERERRRFVIDCCHDAHEMLRRGLTGEEDLETAVWTADHALTLARRELLKAPLDKRAS